MGVVGRAVPPEKRSAALGLIGAGGSFGQFAMLPCAQTLISQTGWLKVLMWLYSVRAVAIALFIVLPLSTFTLWGFGIAMGLTWLGTVPLTNGLVAQIFGVKYLSTLFSIAFLGHQIGSFLGAWYGGLIFDLTGSDKAGWVFSIGFRGEEGGVGVPVEQRGVRAL